MIRDSFAEYWHRSRRLPVGVVMALPLWLAYEVLAFSLNDGFDGKRRTGVDFLQNVVLAKLGVPLAFGVAIPLLLALTFFLRKQHRQEVAGNRGVFWPLMFVESFIYAAVSGMIIGGLSGLFMNAAAGQVVQRRVEALIINLGSGVYEEFVFRLVVLSGLIGLLRKGCSREWLVLTVGIITSSVLFSGFHYLGVFGEPFGWDSFVFRFMAGVVFSGVYLLRGYGIGVYSHTFYNIFLLFR